MNLIFLGYKEFEKKRRGYRVYWINNVKLVIEKGEIK